MATWTTAMQTVERALATGHVGTPVAVRVVAHVTADHGRIAEMAARAFSAACTWLGGTPDRLIARGSIEAGQLSLLTRLDAGQSALVSCGSSGMGRPMLKILVFGNRGVLSWHEGCDWAGDDEQSADLSVNEQTLLRRILQSLDQQPGSATRRQDPDSSVRLKSDTRKAHKPPHGLLLVAGDHTHQPNYAEALVADGRCRLIGLTDEADVSSRRRQLNRQLAERLGIPLLQDLEQAVARDDVHIVSICAEPIRRGRIAVLAAQAGKHLYLDKPLAGSLADADAIAAAARQAGTVDHMFSQVQTDAAQRVRRLVESGELGELTAVHFDLCFAKGEAGNARLGRAREEAAVPDRFELPDSKREMTNVGVYPLVLLLSLLDRSALRVSAVTGNYFFAEHQQNNMEDFGQMLVELEGGLIATFSVGRNGWHSHPAGGLNRAILIGGKRCAVVDAHRPHVAVWADVPAWRPPPRNPEDPMAMWATPPGSPFEAKPRQDWITPPGGPVTDARYFLDCVEQGRASLVTAEVAAAATEILMAAYQSAATGKAVSLPLRRG